MVMAIGPQNAERDSGTMARMAAIAVRMTGRAPPDGRFDDRLAAGEAMAHIRFDLVHENHALRMIMPASAISRAARQSRTLTGDIQAQRAPMMPSGAVRNTRISARCSELDHQERQHGDQHQGKQGKDGGIALSDSSMAPPISIR